MSISYGDFYFTRRPDDIPVKPGNVILDKDNDVLIIDDDVNHRHFIGGNSNGGSGGDCNLFTERRNIINLKDYPGEIIDTEEILYNTIGFCSCWDVDALGIGANPSNNAQGRLCWRAVFNPYNMMTLGAINNSIVTHTSIPSNGIHNSAVFNAGNLITSSQNGIYSSFIFGQAAAQPDGAIMPFLNGYNGISGSTVLSPYGSNMAGTYDILCSDVFLCDTRGNTSQIELNHGRFCFISANGSNASNIGGYLSDVTLLGGDISNCSPYMSRFFGVWSNIDIKDTTGPMYSDIFIYGGNFSTTGPGPYWSSIKSIESHVLTQAPYNDNITYIQSNMLGVNTQANPLLNLTYCNGNGAAVSRSTLSLYGSNFNGAVLTDSIMLGSGNHFDGANFSSSIIFGLGSNFRSQYERSFIGGYYLNIKGASDSVLIGSNIGGTNTILNQSVIIGSNHYPAETIEENGQIVPFIQPQVLIGGATRLNTTDRVAIAESRLPESGTLTAPPHEIIRYTKDEEMILDSNGDITFNYNGNSTSINSLVSQIGDINTILTSIVGV